MNIYRNYSGPIALALLLGLGQAGCNTRAPDTDDAAPAPIASGVETGKVDTATAPTTADTTAGPPPGDTVTTLQPDTPPEVRDSPAAGVAKPSQPDGQPTQGGGLKVTPAEYEGWRQYSVNCARCHGQDVLPNPVAANLLVSLGPKGPIGTPEKFFQVVSEGRPERGMPGFKSLLAPEQINAMYAYVKGRADGRIQAGRPVKPQT